MFSSERLPADDNDDFQAGYDDIFMAELLQYKIRTCIFFRLCRISECPTKVKSYLSVSHNAVRLIYQMQERFTTLHDLKECVGIKINGLTSCLHQSGIKNYTFLCEIMACWYWLRLLMKKSISLRSYDYVLLIEK